jgi:hypothetical protein
VQHQERPQWTERVPKTGRRVGASGVGALSGGAGASASSAVLITIAQRHASLDLRQLGMPVQYVSSLFARTGDERAGQRCAGRPDAPAARRPVAHGLAIRWLWSFRRHSPEKDLRFPCKLSKNGADISKRSRYFQTHT